jgi:hypothetical protein
MSVGFFAVEFLTLVPTGNFKSSRGLAIRSYYFDVEVVHVRAAYVPVPTYYVHMYVFVGIPLTRRNTL